MSTNITPQKIENRIYVTRGNSKFAILFEQTSYIGLFNFTSSLRNSTAIRFSEKIQYFYCENSVSLSSLPHRISHPNNKSNVNMIAYVLHRFSKYRIIHQFVKILLKFVIREHSKSRIKFDISAKPWGLCESLYSMNFFYV